MKKRMITTLSVAFLSIFFGVSEATSQTIKIGGSLPLTGIYSETAKWIKQGYDFWAEDINKRGGLLGRSVQTIMYDDESSVDKAVTYYERAITVDKVDLVFGGYPGASMVALMPLMEKYGKVFVGQGGASMKSFEQGYTYSFGSPPLLGEWVYIALVGVLDDLIPKKEWPKSMAIFTMNTVIGQAPRVNVVKSAEERGIKVVVDEIYNLPLSDATPMVSRAKMKRAELLACMSFFDDGVMIMRAAKAMNYNPKLIFQILASTIPAWMRELGEDGNNVIANMWWHPRLPFPDNSKINEAAKARFGLPEAPNFFGLGYCYMKTLELAVQGAGTLDNMKICDYLRSHKFDLPYGRGITFDSRGLPPPYAFTSQTIDGKVELVWPKSIATTKLVYPRPEWKK